MKKTVTPQPPFRKCDAICLMRNNAEDGCVLWQQAEVPDVDPLTPAPSLQKFRLVQSVCPVQFIKVRDAEKFVGERRGDRGLPRGNLLQSELCLRVKEKLPDQPMFLQKNGRVLQLKMPQGINMRSSKITLWLNFLVSVFFSFIVTENKSGWDYWTTV